MKNTKRDFKDLVRGSKKPMALTTKEWKEWYDESRKKHPFRFWLVEDFYEDLIMTVRRPLEWFYKINFFVYNQWVIKDYCLDTGLERKYSYDLEEKILHGLFNGLVKYVEIDLAWKNVAYDREARKQLNPPWYATSRLSIKPWRSAKAGLDYLRWGINLGVEGSDEDRLMNAKQAQNAQDIFDLYTWWTVTRPNRPDPYKASGWEELDMLDVLDGEQYASDKFKEVWECCDQLESSFYEEDNQMLHKLISIRKGLWV